MTTANATCKRPKKPITAVDLAKDVLRLLKAKKFVPDSMVYFGLPQETVIKNRGESLQKLLQKKSFKPCYACAMGALFLAHVDKFNAADVPDFIRSNLIRRPGYDYTFNDHRILTARLAPFFTHRQLLLIEHAFEGRRVNTIKGLYIEDSDQAVFAAEYFHKQYKTAESRLKGIMKNIIKNDGKFRPQPAPVIYE